MGYWKL